MPSTHLSLHYHIVFSTKDRAPIIEPSWQGRLHAYLGGVVRNVDGIAETVGGVSDHVHLLIGLRATACLANVMRDLKAVSSRWVHEEIGEGAFAWQEGYGAFTVSASQRAQVREYIARQEDHHRNRTFQEEYLELLERSGVEFDTRYCGERPSAAPAGAMPCLNGYRWLTPPANLIQPYGPGDVFQAVAFGPRDEARGSAPFDESASKSPAPSPASGPCRFPA